MDIEVDKVYEMNKRLISDRDTVTGSELKIFKSIDDTLCRIENELIETTGGLTEKSGDYFNLPATKYVQDYFYRKTYRRNKAIYFFFNSLDNFLEEYEKINPENKFAEGVYKKFLILEKYYGLSDKGDLFKNLSLDQAIEIIESFRKEIALEQTRYLIKKNARQ
ncbi:MAG: hypothetical protein U5L96_16140 [Owenweeksia sp.]|nr:hypothetical protein [Owenweeksia sp.]